jgi:hypothetical protein
MLNETDKNMLANVVRSKRDTTDTPPHRSQSSNVPPSGGSSSRGPRHRDDRAGETFPPPAASSLASRIADSSLPPRPAQNVSRDNADKSDRDSQRKRTVSGMFTFRSRVPFLNAMQRAHKMNCLAVGPLRSDSKLIATNEHRPQEHHDREKRALYYWVDCRIYDPF